MEINEKQNRTKYDTRALMQGWRSVKGRWRKKFGHGWICGAVFATVDVHNIYNLLKTNVNILKVMFWRWIPSYSVNEQPVQPRQACGEGRPRSQPQTHCCLSSHEVRLSWNIFILFTKSSHEEMTLHYWEFVYEWKKVK